MARATKNRVLAIGPIPGPSAAYSRRAISGPTSLGVTPGAVSVPDRGEHRGEVAESHAAFVAQPAAAAFIARALDATT